MYKTKGSLFIKKWIHNGDINVKGLINLDKKFMKYL